MKFYPFHIGDYTRRTGHLTPLEDICYRRLLDLYYMTESPIPLDVDKVARLINMRDHSEIVNDIVCEFFTKSDAGYVNETCEEEMQKYNEKASRARKLAEKRWAGQSEDTTSDATLHTTSDTISETTSCATNTITNTNTSIKKKKVADAPVIIPESLDNLEFSIAWQEYISYRSTSGFKDLKHPSIQKTFNEMATWGCEAAIQSLHNSIRNGWQGVFAPRTQANALTARKSLPSEFDHAF
jgi:uncharacterized protein YdaU (DUF1376 family)